MALKIKNHKVLMELLAVPYHKRLIKLLIWCCIRYHEIVITSGYRDKDPGVHGMKPCRGIDIRSWTFDDPQKIVDDINSYHIYDPYRPSFEVAVLHDSGKGEHIHLQAMNRTEQLNVARGT
jgi:hypothetical protein